MTRTLYPKLGWAGKFGIAVGGFVALMFALSGSAMGALIIAAAVGIFLYQLQPGAAWLKLDEKGFTMRNMFRESTTPWSDVESFVVITRRYMMIPIRRTAGYRFSKARKRNVILKAAGALVGFEAELPNTYGMKAVELVALLEAWRQRAVVNAPEGQIVVIR